VEKEQVSQVNRDRKISKRSKRLYNFDFNKIRISPVQMANNLLAGRDRNDAIKVAVTNLTGLEQSTPSAKNAENRNTGFWRAVVKYLQRDKRSR